MNSAHSNVQLKELQFLTGRPWLSGWGSCEVLSCVQERLPNDTFTESGNKNEVKRSRHEREVLFFILSGWMLAIYSILQVDEELAAEELGNEDEINENILGDVI